MVSVSKNWGLLNFPCPLLWVHYSARGGILLLIKEVDWKYGMSRRCVV